MNQFEQKIYNYILNEQLLEAGDRVVIGVSGGADSVCLLRVLVQMVDICKLAPDSFVVVHVHHMIREEEANRDAEFTKMLCEKLRIPCHIFKKDIEAYAKENGWSVEEAGRTYRYICFNEVADRYNCNKIAVAHNQDDLAETVLFHIVRGSGLKGLSGILAKRDNIIRPLLCVPRTEIECYLAQIKQEYCHDSTNDSLDYTRNKIRHVILPCMREINPQAVSHICQIAKDAEDSYDYIHNQAIMNCTPREQEDSFGKHIVLSVSDLFKSGPVLQEHAVREAIIQIAGSKKDITRKHIQSVVGLLYQDTGNMVQLPYGMVARRNYEQLILSDKKEIGSEYYIPITEDGVYDISNLGKILVKYLPWSDGGDVPKKDYTKLLDYGKIKGTLCIRTPENGDYIVIDTNENTKKLSRVFIDAKVDRTMRATWPVLACGNEIIWVIGLRFSPAYYVSEETETVMYIQFEEKE